MDEKTLRSILLLAFVMPWISAALVLLVLKVLGY